MGLKAMGHEFEDRPRGRLESVALRIESADLCGMWRIGERGAFRADPWIQWSTTTLNRSAVLVFSEDSLPSFDKTGLCVCG